MIELALVVISVCAVLITVTVLFSARDARRVLRRMSALLPELECALHETKRSITHVRRLLARGDRISTSVERVIGRICETAGEVVERVVTLKAQAERSVGRWFGTNGHGTRGESRSHRRSRNH